MKGRFTTTDLQAIIADIGPRWAFHIELVPPAGIKTAILATNLFLWQQQ
jgi:hypothetical protein